MKHALKLVGVTLILSTTVATATDKEAKLGKLSYSGSGNSERAPEFGEVTFNFGVKCKASADAVRAAIDSVSGKIWASIIKKVPETAFSETQRTYWGNVENIAEAEGTFLRVTNPQVVAQDKKQVVKHGSTHRYNACSGAELALNAKVPSTFAGSQSFGVRSTDLDWLESLARTVKQINEDKAVDAVKVSVGSIAYETTQATKRAMLEEVLTKARNEATGPGSNFASDVMNLKFASAHFLGHKPSYPTIYHPTPGQPLTRGKPAKYDLTLPFTYVIYAEGVDVVTKSEKDPIGMEPEYEVQGKAVVDADYAEASIKVSSECHATKAAAAAAIEKTAATVLTNLRAYQGTTKPSETDRIVNGEATDGQPQLPYKPIAWDETRADFPATKYLNECTGQEIDAPADEDDTKLATYYSASRTFALKSSNFARILDYVESLQKFYSIATTAVDAVHVTVSNPAGQVVDATRQKLYLQARQSATACVLDPNGPVAKDAAAHGFLCAHLKDMRVGQPVVRFKAQGLGRSRGMAPAAMPMAAMEAAPGGAPEELAVEVVKKNNDERPTFKMHRDFSFEYQFTSKDYLPLLNVKKNTPTP